MAKTLPSPTLRAPRLPRPSAPQRRALRRVENAQLFHRNPANQLGGGGSTAWTRRCRCPPYEPPACPDPLHPNAEPTVGWKTRSFSTETQRANSVAADQPRGQGAAVVHPTSPCLPRPSALQRRAHRRVENAQLFHRNPASQLGGAGPAAWTRRCRCPPLRAPCLPRPSAPQRRARRRVENAQLFHRNPASQLGGAGPTAWTRRCRCPPYEPLPAPTSAPQRRARRRVENVRSTFPPKPGTRQRRTNRVEKAAPPPPYPSSTELGWSGLICVASP